jgi:hypothetical protein
VGRCATQYGVRYTQTHINIGNGEGGVLVNRLTGAGWIIDRRRVGPVFRFIQNGGPDFTNPANYRPAASSALTNANNTNLQEVTEARADLRYALPTTFPLFAKTGLVWRQQVIGATRRVAPLELRRNRPAARLDDGQADGRGEDRPPPAAVGGVGFHSGTRGHQSRAVAQRIYLPRVRRSTPASPTRPSESRRLT